MGGVPVVWANRGRSDHFVSAVGCVLDKFGLMPHLDNGVGLVSGFSLEDGLVPHNHLQSITITSFQIITSRA